MKVAGIHIALFGGIAASIFLALSAFLEWVLAQAHLADAEATHALHLLQFAALAAAGYVAPFGLLAAGISLVAGLQGFAPRWLMLFGLGIAVIAELSTLTLAFPAIAILLPLARFCGFGWMIGIGALLPRTRTVRAAATAAT